MCIEIARGRHSGIQTRMATLSYGEVAICSIVWAELELGAYLSPKGYGDFWKSRSHYNANRSYELTTG